MFIIVLYFLCGFVWRHLSCLDVGMLVCVFFSKHQPLVLALVHFAIFFSGYIGFFGSGWLLPPR